MQSSIPIACAAGDGNQPLVNAGLVGVALQIKGSGHLSEQEIAQDVSR